MSKLIKITQEWINELCQDFQNAVNSMKMSDGKFTFTKSFNSIDRKATLYFTESAYIKMLSLVREFDKEVAWHGVAVRGDDPEKDEYIIKDILVYPQKVTGTNVDTDQEKYQEWLYALPDDVFNNVRMQGHSHVNMGVTPSSVDETLYEKFLNMIDDTMFYIFLIWNKKGDKTIKIYDMAKNVLFGTADVEVKTIDEGFGFEAFMSDAKEMVKPAYTALVSTPAKKPEVKKEEPISPKEDKLSAVDVSKKVDTSTRKKKYSYGDGYDIYDDDWCGSYGYGYGGYYGYRYQY